MMLLYEMSVFLHIVFAAFWIGGMLFLPLVLFPSIKDETNKLHLIYKTGIKFRFYGWIVLTGLIITGSFNMYVKGFWNIEFLIHNDFGKLLGIKLLSFAMMLLIAGIHDFYIGNKAIERIQQINDSKFKYIARWSGRINLILSLLIAFLGVAISRGGIF